jgi:hypothetical protein
MAKNTFEDSRGKEGKDYRDSGRKSGTGENHYSFGDNCEGSTFPFPK